MKFRKLNYTQHIELLKDISSGKFTVLELENKYSISHQSYYNYKNKILENITQ